LTKLQIHPDEVEDDGGETLLCVAIIAASQVQSLLLSHINDGDGLEEAEGEEDSISRSKIKGCRGRNLTCILNGSMTVEAPNYLLLKTFFVIMQKHY